MMVEIRETQLQFNPFAGEIWAEVTTPLTGGGKHMGPVGALEKDGTITWFSDSSGRLESNGITQEDITGDVALLLGGKELLGGQKSDLQKLLLEDL